MCASTAVHATTRASCVRARRWRWRWCPPPRAWPSARRRWRWTSCSRTSTCWSSTSRPAWWCTRRRPLERHPAQRPAGPPCGCRRCALPRAGIVHRLDKDTSGVMVVGKTLPAVTALVRDIAAREVQRQYLAMAPGARSTRRSSASTRRSAATPVQRTRMAVVAGGKPAQTDVERVATCARASARCAAGCTPGARTRSACTWPTAATRWWPMPVRRRPALGLQRQALHATRLAFDHPMTRARGGDRLRAAADFAAAWAAVAGD
jgi:hypothetical protein